MKRLNILLALSGFAFAGVKPKPIPAEDTAIVQALVSSLSQHQQQVNAAVAKQEARLCQEVKIKRDVCLVDWQHGTVGPKPKEEPKPITPAAK